MKVTTLKAKGVMTHDAQVKFILRKSWEQVEKKLALKIRADGRGGNSEYWSQVNYDNAYNRFCILDNALNSPSEHTA